jgi:hypothetical protein
MMQYEAMHEIFNQCPQADTRENDGNPRQCAIFPDIVSADCR